jgi:hypothetical protein
MAQPCLFHRMGLFFRIFPVMKHTGTMGHDRETMRHGCRQRVMVLGNCVAERLQFMLMAYPGFSEAFAMAPAPPIHTLKKPEQWQALADAALSCDILFTQPLFHFGPCNTAELRKALGQTPPEAGGRLLLFASPNFEAYFPDAALFKGKENLRFDPILDWDSTIIFSCFCSGVPIFDVEDLYCNHPLFHPATVEKKIALALDLYLQREKDLDITTKNHIIRGYRQTKLFHSPKHPADSLLGMMLRDMAASLKLNSSAPLSAIDGFGFNQWPVITRHHKRFNFPEQAYFVLAGKKCSLEDVAMAYYNFYEFHPHVVAANRDKSISV